MVCTVVRPITSCLLRGWLGVVYDLRMLVRQRDAAIIRDHFFRVALEIG